MEITIPGQLDSKLRHLGTCLLIFIMVALSESKEII